MAELPDSWKTLRRAVWRIADELGQVRTYDADSSSRLVTLDPACAVD
jgi:hypothetical protein